MRVQAAKALALVLIGAAAAPGARAQPVAGLYVGAGAGYGFLQSQSVQSPAAVLDSAQFGGGIATVGSVGYGIGNGLRLELEGSWRDNAQSHGVPGNGRESKAGVMLNALFDFDTGLPGFYPYVGLGGGYQWARWSAVDLAATVPGAPGQGSLTASGTAGEPAYQVIVGAAVPINAVPGLSVTLEYRFLGLAGTRDYAAVATGPSGAVAATSAHTPDDANHAVMLGVRYAFTPREDLSPVSRPPLATPAAAPTPTRTYLVFFDWDSAALSARARNIIAEAARNSARVEHTRLDVTGHADRTGGAEYNRVLSLRRAQAVAAEVERWGIPEQQIEVRGVGDAQPLVPTGAGVREPQNRRVEIIYR